MYQSLINRVVVITGGSSGIGWAAVRRFLSERAKVHVIDLKEPPCFTDVFASAERLYFHYADISHTEQVVMAIDEIIEDSGAIDILINNAGICRDARLVDMDIDDFDDVMDVNVRGMFLMTKEVAHLMAEQGHGVIINVASVVARAGNYGQTAYVASKAAVVGMTKTWSRELAKQGVRVVGVAPGFIETPMTAGMPEKVLQGRILPKVGMGRLGLPEEVANVFAWLASDEASYVTGTVVEIDGGTNL